MYVIDHTFVYIYIAVIICFLVSNKNVLSQSVLHVHWDVHIILRKKSMRSQVKDLRCGNT